jgi:hypothetical protein
VNWLERARREIQGASGRPTANTAEGRPAAVLAVPSLALDDGDRESIGSNGSTLPECDTDTAALSDEFEERAAIMEFDGNLGREDAEHAAWALVSTRRIPH